MERRRQPAVAADVVAVVAFVVDAAAVEVVNAVDVVWRTVSVGVRVSRHAFFGFGPRAEFRDFGFGPPGFFGFRVTRFSGLAPERNFWFGPPGFLVSPSRAISGLAPPIFRFRANFWVEPSSVYPVSDGNRTLDSMEC